MDRARLAWASRLRVPPEAFAHSGILVVERAGLDSVVTIAFADACVVLTPTSLTEPIERLDLDTLTDAAALARVLARHARCSPIGTAELWFTHTSPPAGDVTTEVATEAGLAVLRADCAAEEWDEAGLDDMTHRWAIRAESGAVAAVAGYDEWDELAHLGVLTALAHRGQGFAYAAAARAVTQSIATGRLAQWRCRVGNAPSTRLAAQLGFVRAGVQTTIIVKANG